MSEPLSYDEDKKLIKLDKKIRKNTATRSELGQAINLKRRKVEAGVKI